MKLFILKPKDDIYGNNPWEPWYDKCFEMVVRAKNEKHARVIASENNSDEDSNAWIDSNLSTCIEITKTGEPGLIIRNIHNA